MQQIFIVVLSVPHSKCSNAIGLEYYLMGFTLFCRPLTPENEETEESSNPPPDDVETRLVSMLQKL